VLLGLTSALPLAWENVVGGFQSQFAFLAGFSLLAMYLLLTARALSWRWWGGILAGLIALVSMGSGFFFALPVLLITGWQLWRHWRGASSWVTLITAGFLAGFGWWARAYAPWQKVLWAHSIKAFWLCLIHCLAWPRPEWPWLAVVLWLPWFVFVVGWLKSRSSRRDAAASFIVAGGLWVLLQVVAVAYTRASSSLFPATRYYDILSLGLLFSFFGLAKQAGRSTGWIYPTWAALWVVIVAANVIVSVELTYAVSLPQKKGWSIDYERNVQAYILTGKRSHIDKQPLTQIPLFSGTVLADLIDPAPIRQIMPASVRAPLSLQTAAGSFGFAPNGLSSSTPPLAFRQVRGSLRKAKDTAEENAFWQSASLPPSPGGYLKFETAGFLGQPGLSLSLVSAETGSILADIRPSKLPGDTWRAAYVRRPKVSFIVVARTFGSSRWFAFSDPVELSALSYWSWQIARQGRLVLAVGLALGLAGACFVARAGRLSSFETRAYRSGI